MSFLSCISNDVFAPNIIDAAPSEFVIPIVILDPKARKTTYLANVFKRPESVGYNFFAVASTKKSLLLSCSQLQPKILQNGACKRAKYEKTFETLVKVFINILTCETVNCQAYSSAKSAESPLLKQKNRGGSATHKIENSYRPGPE